MVYHIVERYFCLHGYCPHARCHSSGQLALHLCFRSVVQQRHPLLGFQHPSFVAFCGWRLVCLTGAFPGCAVPSFHCVVRSTERLPKDTSWYHIALPVQTYFILKVKSVTEKTLKTIKEPTRVLIRHHPNSSMGSVSSSPLGFLCGHKFTTASA